MCYLGENTKLAGEFRKPPGALIRLVVSYIVGKLVKTKLQWGMAQLSWSSL